MFTAGLITVVVPAVLVVTVRVGKADLDEAETFASVFIAVEYVCSLVPVFGAAGIHH